MELSFKLSLICDVDEHYCFAIEDGLEHRYIQTNKLTSYKILEEYYNDDYEDRPFWEFTLFENADIYDIVEFDNNFKLNGSLIDCIVSFVKIKIKMMEKLVEFCEKTRNTK